MIENGSTGRGVMANNILITGPPRVGKTTLIQRIIQECQHFHLVGFYTKEIRDMGIRKGFELIGLDGRKGILSHMDIQSSFHISKYKVDVSGFEEFLNPTAYLSPDTDIIIIDEIGKMECLSQKFNRLIEKILDSEKFLIATIAIKGPGLITEVKQRNDVTLLQMTPSNREHLFKIIIEAFS